MIEKLILKSIKEEATDCRKAFEGVEIGAWVSHCHHGRDPFEKLTEPAENRIVYIRKHKPIEEQALRLRLFRPKSKEQAESYEAKRDALWADYEAKRDALWADYEAKRDALWADYAAKLSALHREYCTADCPWNGWTLFPKREG